VLESFRREQRVTTAPRPHFQSGTAVAERTEEMESSAMMLMGIGNVAGPGMALADHFGQDQGWERFRTPVTRPARVLEMV
ncbi:MAG: poly-gamma-glutamate synthase PgsB, partial [Rhodopirellula bahusiensis]